jgi:MFS family permease
MTSARPHGATRQGPDAADARRTLVLLTALKQVSSGLVLATWLLTAGARGLDATQVGLLVAVAAFGTAALELPTGGLADVLGRRVALAAAALGTVACYVVLAVADSPQGFYLAAALLAVSGALASGPLEAWYVDQVGAQQEEVRRGLGRAATATGFALAAGGLLGGALTQLGSLLDLPAEGPARLLALSVPFMVAAGIAASEAVLVLLLVRDGGPEVSSVRASSWVRALVDELPRTVLHGARLALSDRVLRWFALRWLLVPVGFLALELLSPLRLVDLLDDPAGAAAVMGPLTAGCFVGTGLTAAAAPWLARRAGVLLAAAVSTVVAGACFALAGAGGVVLLVVGVLGGFLVSGPGNPLLGPLVHERVTGRHRATVLSVRSLAGNVAVGIGAVALGAVGQVAGTGWGFVLAGTVTALAALPLLGVAAGRRAEARQAPAVPPG